jgi:hypothetical protein
VERTKCGKSGEPELQRHSAPVPENDCPDPWAGSGGRCTRTSISISGRVGDGGLEEAPRTLTLTQPLLQPVVNHLSAEYRKASGITVCLRSTAIIRPDTPNSHSACRMKNK